MTVNKAPKERMIKVEEVGDHWRRRTFPRIRLKGKWLADAGITPNSYIRVDNPRPGVLTLHLVEDAE